LRIALLIYDHFV